MFPLNRLGQLIRRVTANKKTQPCSRRKAAVRFRLEVEHLEARELPAVLLDLAPPVFSAPASPTTDTTPTFSWSASAGTTRYDLWVNNLTTGQAQVIRNQSLTTTFTPLTPLSAGAYQAWIDVTTAAGTSPWSSTYSFAITPPTIPTLTAPTGSPAGMTPTFRWSASTAATRYDLWVTNLTTGQNQIVRQQNLTTNSFTPSTALPMGAYQAWVQAFNNAGDSAGWSAGLSFIITGPPAPTFTAPIGPTLNTSPTVSWTATAGANRYDLWVSNISTGQDQIIRQQNLAASFFTPANPLPPGSYQAWVQAYNGSLALGGWSTALNFAVVPPAAPTLTGPPAVTTDTTPTFTWAASTAAMQYDVWADNLTTGQSQVVRRTVSTTSLTPANAIPRGQYIFWVRAANSAGNFGSWGIGYRFLVDTTAPAIPTITAPASPAESLTPTIAWSASNGTARYDLWVDNVTTGQAQVIRQQNLAANSFTPATALSPGDYVAWVGAFDNTDQTRGWSAAYNFTLTTATIGQNLPVISAGPNKSGNEGSAIRFSGTASGGVGPLTYAWVFGDDGTATGSLTPSHTYVSDGSYIARLTVTDSQGHAASATTLVTVNNVAPTPNSGGPYSGKPGIGIKFTGTATDPDPTDTLSYLWNFGDGSTSAQQAPTHTYNSAKTYNVSLTVTDSDGASATVATTAVVSLSLIVVSAGPNKSGNEGSAIQFSGTASGGTGTLTYAWAFGDGGTATGTLTPSHTYVTRGSYTATLTVTDGQGGTASSTTTVTVSNVPPTVSSGGPYSGTTGTAVRFTPTVSDPDPTDIFSYAWNFGDGATSTQQKPSHTYASAGSYNVSLTVTDSGGLTATTATTATVIAGNAPFLNNVNPPPLPAPTGTVINVSTVSALQSAVANLQSGQTIVIAPGTYNLTAGLYIGKNSHLTNVGIRGATDNWGDVVLLGQGMDNSNGFGMGISVWNAQNVTIANLSVGNVYYDAIELKGDQGADRVTIYNCHLFDSGEQIIKSDPNATGGGVTNSSVQYCTIGYTTAPSTADHGGGTGYTNGVDVHGGSNWLVSNNLFQNFHTPDGSANLWNPTVLFWNHSANNTVSANTFINCDRAIALGLIEQTTGFDNQGGLIANNFVYMAPGEFSAARQAGADAPIIAWDSPGTVIAFNTILTSGNMPNSIQVRFVETTNVYIQDNLADASVRSRDGAVYIASENYLTAAPSMFVNAAAGDLHLVSNSATQTNIIGKAVSPASVSTDYDGQARNTPMDLGADQFLATTSTLVVTAGPSQSGDEGSVIQLSGTASGGTGPLSYSWSFGDGGTATGTLTPSHIYLSDGSYAATLTVTDSAGRSTFNSTIVTVNNVAPTVNIGGPYIGVPGTAISFTGAATVPDPTDTLTFAWNFGDGSTSTQQKPSHVYASSGTFNVSLTVTDSDGLSTTATTTATASTGPAIGTLTVSPNSVTAGASITLTAGNVTDIGGAVTQVAFYISAVGGSSTHAPTDTFLGNGVQGSTPSTNHNWNLTVSTTGLAPGTYTIFAQAVDSNSLLSVPFAATLTVQ